MFDCLHNVCLAGDYSA